MAVPRGWKGTGYAAKNIWEEYASHTSDRISYSVDAVYMLEPADNESELAQRMELLLPTPETAFPSAPS